VIENLVLIAKEDRAAAAHRGYGADLHFDNRFTHIANLVTRMRSFMIEPDHAPP
jgi:hypothetical protein